MLPRFLLAAFYSLAPPLPSTAQLKLHGWNVVLSCQHSWLQLRTGVTMTLAMCQTPSKSWYPRKGPLELADPTVRAELNSSPHVLWLMSVSLPVPPPSAAAQLSQPHYPEYVDASKQPNVKRFHLVSYRNCFLTLLQILLSFSRSY